MDLPALYASREFADLTLIAANGEEFQVHRLVLGQFPQLKALIVDAEERNRRITMVETAEVLRLLIQWLYGVPWCRDPHDTIKGRASALMNAVELAHVAEKVRTSQLLVKVLLTECHSTISQTWPKMPTQRLVKLCARSNLWRMAYSCFTRCVSLAFC